MVSYLNVKPLNKKDLKIDNLLVMKNKMKKNA